VPARNSWTGFRPRIPTVRKPRTWTCPFTVGWNAAVKAGVSREEMDAWALRSHRNAIAPSTRSVQGGDRSDRDPTRTFRHREHPRRDTTLEKLASLKTLHPEIEGSPITRATPPAPTRRGRAHHRQRQPWAARARPVLSWASVGVRPRGDRTGAGRGIPKALARAGLSLADVDLFEINEAFAAMCAWPPSSCSRSIPIWSTSAAADARSAIRWPPACPDAGDADPRTSPPRRWHRRRGRCAPAAEWVSAT